MLENKKSVPISPALRFGGFSSSNPAVNNSPNINTDYNVMTDEYSEAKVDM